MSKSPLVMLIDDDARFRRYLSRILGAARFRFVECASGPEGLEKLKGGVVPDLILLDIMMPGMDGLTTLPGIRSILPQARIIMLSALDDPKHVVAAVKGGAMDFLSKDADPEDLRAMVARVLGEAIPASESAEALSSEGVMEDPDFICVSEAMRSVRNIAHQVADLPVKVLLLGESGTGKDVLARYIHKVSARRDHPFVKVNCAAMPGDLIESELFGFEKGAFTGATQSKPGQFDLSGEGTIFLDEIGEFAMGTQAKLLQALEDNEFTRLGGVKPVHIKSRVIVATNRDLEAEIRRGNFRQDLYYRLHVVNVTLPPLRDRMDDFEPLLQTFLSRFSEEFGRPAPPIPERLSRLLSEYHWPGNIRELKNVVRKFVLFQDPVMIAEEIGAKQISLPGAAPQKPQAGEPAADEAPPEGLKALSRKASEAVERQMILQALAECNWNRKRAAEMLQISYKAFRYKIKDMGIDRKTAPAGGTEAET